MEQSASPEAALSHGKGPSNVWLRCPNCESLLAVRVATASEPTARQQVGNVKGPAGKATLTPHDREILRLIALGARDRDIAVACGFSLDWAKRAVRSLLTRLAAQNRTEAAVRAVADGLIDIA